MFCKIDPQSGNILGKFRASAKAISSISVSPDGKILTLMRSWWIWLMPRVNLSLWRTKLGLEKKLRALDILGNKGDSMLTSMIDLEANISQRKMRTTVISMETDDVSKLLESLVAKWRNGHLSSML